jgi:hypothetical protein
MKHLLLMKNPFLISAIPLIAFLAGCSSISPYMKDRARDLTDVAHIDVTCMSVGVGVNVGPSLLGFNSVSAPCGDGKRLKFGLGILSSKAESRSSSTYGKTFPPWGSVGGDVGLIFGLSARADVVELVDFFLGIATVDILKDDEGIEAKLTPIEKNKSEK